MTLISTRLLLVLLVLGVTACTQIKTQLDYNYDYNFNYDQALALKTQLIASDSTNPESYIGRGSIYYLRWRDFGNAGDLDHALADFDMAIKVDPRNADGYYRRGRGYADNGLKNSESNLLAIRDLSQSIDIDAKFVQPYVIRSIVYSRNKDQLALALKDANTAIQLDPTLPTAYRIRSIIYQEMGDKQAAKASLEIFVNLAPNGIDPKMDPPCLIPDPGFLTQLKSQINDK